MDNLRTIATPTLSVRRLGHKDAPAYAELLVGLETQDRIERFVAPMSDSDLQTYGMRLFMSHAPVLGTYERGEIIGAIDIGADESGVADIGLVVAKSHRRRGHGRRLMQAALDLCAGIGIEDIYFDCFITNQPMVALAQEMGFRELCRDRPSTFHRSIVDVPVTNDTPPKSATVIDFFSRRKISA